MPAAPRRPPRTCEIVGPLVQNPLHASEPGAAHPPGPAPAALLRRRGPTALRPDPAALRGPAGGRPVLLGGREARTSPGGTARRPPGRPQRPPPSRSAAAPRAPALPSCTPAFLPPGSRLVFIDPDVAFTSWMKGAGSARETPPRRRGCGTAACPRLRRAPSWGRSAVPLSLLRCPASGHLQSAADQLPGHPAQGGCRRPRLLRVFFNKIKGCSFLGVFQCSHFAGK